MITYKARIDTGKNHSRDLDLKSHLTIVVRRGSTTKTTITKIVAEKVNEYASIIVMKASLESLSHLKDKISLRGNKSEVKQSSTNFNFPRSISKKT